jgi:hypothetical protein
MDRGVVSVKSAFFLQMITTGNTPDDQSPESHGKAGIFSQIAPGFEACGSGTIG